MGPEAREELGRKAMTRARREYDTNKMVSDWDTSLEKTIADWKSGNNPKWKVTEL